MSARRKRSSTKRDNLTAYWLDANTFRLRGYPPAANGEATPQGPPQPEPNVEPAVEPRTEPAAERRSAPKAAPKAAKAARKTVPSTDNTEATRPRRKRLVHNEREPLPPYIRAGHTVEITDKRGWNLRLDEQGARALLVVRDRFGFRWERWIGLHDDVSQVEAAKLVGVPLTRLNRWVRTKKLKSRTLQGYSVIRARDLYQLALDLKLEVPRGRPFIVVGLHHEDP